MEHAPQELPRFASRQALTGMDSTDHVVRPVGSAETSAGLHFDLIGGQAVADVEFVLSESNRTVVPRTAFEALDTRALPGSLGDVALRPRSSLRRVLMATDAAVVAAVWAVAVRLAEVSEHYGFVAAVVAVAMAVSVTVLALHAGRLYTTARCQDRPRARVRLVAASCAAPATWATTDLAVGHPPSTTALGALAGITFLALVGGRQVFEEWLRVRRLQGDFARPVVVAGTGLEVGRISRLLAAHPELGCRSRGWIGDRHDRPRDPDGTVAGPWLGSLDELPRLARRAGATAVLAGPSLGLTTPVAQYSRELASTGVRLQVWSGLPQIGAGRLGRLPLAHEAFVDLSPAGASPLQLRAKRVIDVILASAVLVLTGPLLILAALLIKRHDGGPVLFRQVRVGQNGRLVVVRKLRTMAVDAEAQLDALRGVNERSGPLFKMAVDPRVTPVGRILRATSMDEIPQLLDVLAGRLSLVGPRPALPDEVAAFDEHLLVRHHVLPGVTGLWQAEARHNPSFEAYRHLDLYYVENWSVRLDVLILLATARTIVVDALRLALSWRPAVRREKETSPT